RSSWVLQLQPRALRSRRHRHRERREMAKKTFTDEPPVRKSLLIVAGVAVGAALLGFIIVHFAFSSGGGGTPLPSTSVVPGVVQKISGSCASFDQGGTIFSVCQGQTVKR